MVDLYVINKQVPVVQSKQNPVQYSPKGNEP